MVIKIAFSVGHILFSHPDRQKTVLTPPMEGFGPYSKILNWIESKKARFEFVPSIPPHLVAPSEPRFKNLHRLMYRSSGIFASPSSSMEVMKLEIPLEPHGAGLDVGVTGPDMYHILRASGTPRMWTGHQSEANVLMPQRSDGTYILSFLDRPFGRAADVRLTVEDLTLSSDADLPLVLQQYVTELDT